MTVRFKTFCILLLAGTFFLCNAHTAPAQKQDVSFSSYRVIEERNIFRPNKGGDEESSAASEQLFTQSENASTAKDLVLTGIVKIKKRFMAVIEKKEGNKGFYVRKGDWVEDYQVQSVLKDRVMLEKDGRIFILKLQVSSNTKPDLLNRSQIKENPTGQTAESSALPVSDTNIMRNLRMGVRYETP